MYHTCIIHVAIFSIHVTLCDFLFKSCVCIFLYHYCMAPHIGVTVYPTIYGHILHADLWHFYEKYHINCVPFVYYNCTAPHRCGSSVGYLWTHQTTGEERAGASPTDAKWRKWQSSYLVISHCILAYLIISHQWWIIISYQISSYVVICFPSPIITYHILVAYLCLLPNNKNDTHHIILPYLIICYAIFMKSDKVQVLFWYHILAVRSHWCKMIEMYQILSYIFICYHHLSLESLNLESPTKNMYIWELPVLISGRTRHRCAVHTYSSLVQILILLIRIHRQTKKQLCARSIVCYVLWLVSDEMGWTSQIQWCTVLPAKRIATCGLLGDGFNRPNPHQSGSAPLPVHIQQIPTTRLSTNQTKQTKQRNKQKKQTNWKTVEDSTFAPMFKSQSWT